MATTEDTITELRQTVAELRRVIEQQHAVIEQLRWENQELKRKLATANKNSTNSSKPPSSDIVAPAKTKRDRRRRRKIGGQKGHRRALRQPLPAERVDHVIEHRFDDQTVQDRQLTPTGDYQSFQHIELLELPIRVTESRRHQYRDPEGKLVYPDAPGWNAGPIFGPRLITLIGYLKSRCHCSYRTIEALLADVLELPVSRGYLAKLCNTVVSQSIADAHEELKAALPAQRKLGTDESSIKRNGRKHWVWVLTAATFTVFHIAGSRARRVLEELLGDRFGGSLNYDYYSSNVSFTKNFPAAAQFCWAHLVRDIRFLTGDPDAEVRQWAEHLLERSRRMFVAWHDRGSMSPDGFHRSMMTHRGRFLELIDQVPESRAARALADRFAVVDYTDGTSIDHAWDYFRFMLHDDLEPTNNHAEQQVRHCVIDRKITQGTRSAAGERYHERMWSAIATCGKQDRNFYDYLLESVTAKLAGRPAPSLLTS